jgi:hypothetical protein
VANGGNRAPFSRTISLQGPWSGNIQTRTRPLDHYMSRILLPLRSNAAWFADEQARQVLEARLKNYLLLYDEIILQDGRYQSTVLDTGSLDSYYPPGSIRGDRTKITYYRPGTPFAFMVRESKDGPDVPVGGLTGPRVFTYEADFYPIIASAGLVSADFIQWLNGDLVENLKEQAKDEARRDLTNSAISESIPGNHFVKAKVLESLYHDASLANHTGLDFAVDYRAGPAVRLKNELESDHWGPEARATVGRAWVSLDLPDYGQALWEEVIAVRESAAGKDFRRLVERVAAAVDCAALEGIPPSELQHLAERKLAAELAKELKERTPTVRAKLLSLAINLISTLPVVGALANAAGVATETGGLINALRERRTWVSLLYGPKR